MKKFIDTYRNRIWMQAIGSSAIICFFIYTLIRIFSYDFPMTWREEIFLFFKIIFTGTFLMVLATTGSAIVYRLFLRIKRNNRLS